MSGKKVKLSNKESDHDDLLKPCFQIGSDVQLKEIPATGEEYLLKVIKERQKYATITKCSQDYSKFAQNQNCFVKEIPRAAVCEKLKPTIEWQNVQVADFSEMRMYLSRLRARKSEYSSKIVELKEELQTLREWRKFFEVTEPTLSNVLGIPNSLLDTGLEKLIEALEDIKAGGTIDYRTGQWIYALLSCVIQPLLSETTCILRDLSRKCAEIRSHINPDDENAAQAAAPMNIFICIVGRYFRQYDLAD